MRGFSAGTVVRVPFPYTDRALRQHRPALVISDGPIGEQGRLLWVLMITSADNRPWPGDVAIEDHEAAGLPSPSTIRTSKMMTIETSDAEWKGEVPPTHLDAVRAALGVHLGRGRS